MLKNQLKSVLRTLRAQKGYAILNIVGLSIGIALSILAFRYVQHEYSFDRHYSKADRLYRVVQEIRVTTAPILDSRTGDGLAQSFLENFPEVVQAGRIFSPQVNTLQYGDELFRSMTTYAVDTPILEMLDIEVVSGSPRGFFTDPSTLIISETAAKTIFGDEDPIGQTLTATGPFLASHDHTIAAVARDMPVNTHFRFDFLRPANRLRIERARTSSRNVYTYILLREDYSPEQLEEKFPAYIDRVIGPEIGGRFGRSWEEITDSGGGWSLSLQSIKDLHLDNQYKALGRRGSHTSIYFFSLIAFFILVLACVNFMNLATARSSKRVKEVGVRKVVGSSRRQLISQFLIESVVVSLFSLIGACAAVTLLIPAFNEFLDTEVTFNLFERAYIVPGLILLAVVVGISAGGYPAFFLSRFRPIELLRGADRTGSRGVSLRDGLVVFQFMISVLLIVATLVVYRQLSFMRNKDMGFDAEHVLVLQDIGNTFKRTEAVSYRAILADLGYSVEDWRSLTGDQQRGVMEGSDGVLDWINPMTASRMRSFKERLLQIPGIQSASISQAVPGRTNWQGYSFQSADASDESLVSTVYTAVDIDFLETLQLELVAGTNLKEEATPNGSALLNETAAKLFGADDPIGSTITELFLKIDNQTNRTFEAVIAGVVKDFQFQDMRTEIQPTFFLNPYPTSVFPHMIVRLQSGNLQATLASIESTWREFIPDETLTYSFLDEDFARLFENEKRLSKAFGFFSTLAIFIACLGLFGLATFMTERRTKEIGIRKTLGASVRNIVQLLSRHFLWLLLIGNLAAWPIGYIIMNKWLENFAFRTNIGVGIFILTGAVALVLVVISVGGQALRASLANPVDSLRYE